MRQQLMDTRRAGAMALGAWATAIVLALPATGRAQVSPEESARKMKPADGLEATLWAAEPMLVNPTNLDVDSRGRVWVTEGLNYRPTRNRSLPPKEDADKIKILEDTDGDGKADKVTVFADKIFPVPMGIAVEEQYGKDGKYRGARVFIGNSPDILVLEDTDGDDKADKRYPLLSGFGGIDSDHGVHGTVLGPDGKLYFTHGDGCCSIRDGKEEGTKNFDVVDRSGRHVSSDLKANTLRSNRDGTQFEVIADRQRNNYETCLNSFGNGFTSDNDDDGNRGCRVIWVMDGGHYGYQTPGSPRHWAEDVPGMVPKLVGTGNGSPCGVMVYEGDLLPEEYRGAVLEAEAGPRQINVFPLTRSPGGSFRTVHKVLLASDDPWFRPVDVCAAPDGSVLVADWYDAGVGGHSFRDQTTGRIYRLAPKGKKAESKKADFASIAGLIDALKSPVVATRDVARRLLIERGQEPEARDAVAGLVARGEPIYRARALWVGSAILGDPAATAELKNADPRIREQAVRILGRDDSRNGKVEFTKPGAETELLASKNLKVLLPMASDPDAGVRRELILALRNLPTDQVGEALKTLARTWDGQDRWYLEALGLALEKREGPYLASLFDGTLFGDLDLAEAGQASKVALPPYFPADRNEAYIVTGEQPLPASALSKTLGLAWRLHRPESLPLLGRIIPSLATPELQQAADDAMTQMGSTAAAVALSDLAMGTNDPLRRRQIYETLARRLDNKWRDARNEGKVVELIVKALADPEARVEGIAMAAATKEGRYAETLLGFARDAKAPADVRAAAVEAIGAIKPPEARAVLDGLIGEAKEKGSSHPAAEAAIRTLPKLGDARHRLMDLISGQDLPLGLRREALRTFAIQEGGARRVIAMAREGKLADDLKTEASTLLASHRDARVRHEAEAVLPLPKAASGRPLPPLQELLRRDGKAEDGRTVFFREGATSCAGCHRVQGRGRWIGPDLSTIGTKYGKDELLRSILNPSAAIGYNYRSAVVSLSDGRVVTGLAVEDAPDRLVLKTAEGQRIVVKPSEIEDRKNSDVSLMPEGLAQSMTDAELVDLLAFLSTLKQPVSVVGQYQAIGPLSEKGHPAFDVTEKVNPAAKLPGADGPEVAWRRLTANAEGLVDLGPLAGSDSTRAVYLHTTVTSPAEQDVRLVLDTQADVKLWLGGRPVALAAPKAAEPRAAIVSLPRGTLDLLIRVPGGPNAAVVTTIVSPRPLEFGLGEGAKVSQR